MIPPRPVPIPATGASLVVVGGACLLLGWAFVNESETDRAEIELFNGNSANGDTVVPITLSGDQSTRDYPPYPGIFCDAGVFLDVIDGDIRGSLTVVPVDANTPLIYGQGPLPIWSGTT